MDGLPRMIAMRPSMTRQVRMTAPSGVVFVFIARKATPFPLTGFHQRRLDADVRTLSIF